MTENAPFVLSEIAYSEAKNHMKDSAFTLAKQFSNISVHEALHWDTQHNPTTIPPIMPEHGIGEFATLGLLSPRILDGARRLNDASAFAHMDPPTPWITWIVTLWNASLNQNLLHPDTAPTARNNEQQVIEWLAPYFGMTGGHMLPGSTLANLSGMWAARDIGGAQEIVASSSAHLSIQKAAKLLGMRYRVVETDLRGRMKTTDLGDLSNSCLVLTAGTTSVGAIDSLQEAGRAAWTHVDAAWGGPLRLSTSFAHLLDGIENADSVAMSAHKWLFQPKESALIFFRDVQTAHEALSFGGGYLAVPNVGLLGSHGAIANPLLAMLLAWGRSGLAQRIEQCMDNSFKFAQHILAERRLELWNEPVTGIVVWRPRTKDAESLHAQLPEGTASLTTLNGEKWLRNVAANPNADIDRIFKFVISALER